LYTRICRLKIKRTDIYKETLKKKKVDLPKTNDSWKQFDTFELNRKIICGISPKMIKSWTCSLCWDYKKVTFLPSLRCDSRCNNCVFKKILKAWSVLLNCWPYSLNSKIWIVYNKVLKMFHTLWNNLIWYFYWLYYFKNTAYRAVS